MEEKKSPKDKPHSVPGNTGVTSLETVARKPQPGEMNSSIIQTETFVARQDNLGVIASAPGTPDWRLRAEFDSVNRMNTLSIN
ncbi:hypothetical protein ZHAS_00002027 [Anopheles sinensis]|uniref:Uncharacterized protein n=1 Tax=Anopheles sinensis TaxID=74873 RepID=A0A084VBQ3_ANOSI|nr:hypothetical protein ZHAS_00002027 [Anopheles sinensis]